MGDPKTVGPWPGAQAGIAPKTPLYDDGTATNWNAMKVHGNVWMFGCAGA